MYRITSFLLLLVGLLVFTSASLHDKSPLALLSATVSAIDDIQTVRYSMKKKERQGKSYIDGEIKVKQANNPFRIYCYLVKPNEGTEVLYKAPDKKAMVHIGFFPWITTNLDILGNRIMDDNHHPINHSGFNYFGGIIDHLLKTQGANNPDAIEYKGTISHNGQSCHHIVLESDDYEIKEVTITKKEQMSTYADRTFVSGYKLKELNDLDFGEYLEVGQKIKVPNYYAKSMTIYLSEKTNLPVVMDIYDELGSFAKYEFHNVQVNTFISDEEFSKDYEEYGF